MTDGIVVQLVAGPEETIAPREMYPAREILQQYDGADIQIVTKKSPSPASTSVLPVVQELIANIPWAALASGGVVVARSATAIAREWLAGNSKRSVEIERKNGTKIEIQETAVSDKLLELLLSNDDDL